MRRRDHATQGVQGDLAAQEKEVLLPSSGARRSCGT